MHDHDAAANHAVLTSGRFWIGWSLRPQILTGASDVLYGVLKRCSGVWPGAFKYGNVINVFKNGSIVSLHSLISPALSFSLSLSLSSLSPSPSPSPSLSPSPSPSPPPPLSLALALMVKLLHCVGWGGRGRVSGARQLRMRQRIRAQTSPLDPLLLDLSKRYVDDTDLDNRLHTLFHVTAAPPPSPSMPARGLRARYSASATASHARRKIIFRVGVSKVSNGPRQRRGDMRSSQSKDSAAQVLDPVNSGVIDSEGFCTGLRQMVRRRPARAALRRPRAPAGATINFDWLTPFYPLSFFNSPLLCRRELKRHRRSDSGSSTVLPRIGARGSHAESDSTLTLFPQIASFCVHRNSPIHRPEALCTRPPWSSPPSSGLLICLLACSHTHALCVLPAPF